MSRGIKISIQYQAFEIHTWFVLLRYDRREKRTLTFACQWSEKQNIQHCLNSSKFNYQSCKKEGKSVALTHKYATFTFLGWYRYINDKWRDNASLMNIMPTFKYNWKNSAILKNDMILNIMHNRINLRS